MTQQMAATLVNMNIPGILVQSEFVCEGLLRRSGELLPAKGNFVGIIQAQYAMPATSQQMKQGVKCDVDGCERRFVDEATRDVHKTMAHDPARLEMMQRLAEGLDPEPAPVGGERAALRDAMEILPQGVTGNRMGGPGPGDDDE